MPVHFACRSEPEEFRGQRVEWNVVRLHVVRQYDNLIARLGKEAGPDGFQSEMQQLLKLRDEHQRLGEAEKAELQALHATAETRQKQAFLDRCFIDSAVIHGVGLAKKSALRSFGIETAADVTHAKVIRVRGFGDKLTASVVGWKKSCEQRFKFDARSAVSEADKNGVRAKFAARKRVLEAALGGGGAVLNRYRAEAAAKAKALEPMLLAAAQKLAQSEADSRVV